MQDSRPVTSSRCCDSGHPIAIDPSTGSTVCSCKIHSGVPAYLSRVPRLPESFYGPISTGHGNSDSAAAYYQSVNQYPADRLMDGRPAVPGMTPTVPYLAAHPLAAHPYSPFYPDFDLLSARRKNATRETTGPLKSWLYQHRKNPYPTKAEKVMLAIITQMTLTQVSTWFANARRRLKKENKLGKDVDISDIDVEDKAASDVSILNTSIDSSNSDGSIAGHRDRLSSAISDISDAEDRASPNTVPKKCVQRLFSPDSRNEVFMDRMSSPESSKTSETSEPCKDIEINVTDISETTKKDEKSDHNQTSGTTQTKPKIWSVADMLR